MQKRTIFKGIATSATIGIIAMTSLSPAFAVVNTPGRAAATNRVQLRNQICTETQERVQNRINNRTTISNQYTSRYNNLVTSLNKIKATVTEKYPTVSLINLNADIVKLEELYNKAISASNEANTSMEGVDFTKCASGSGEFKTGLENARLKSKQALDAHKAYWTFVKETLKVDMQKIKSDILSIKAE
jgi:membrane-associated HD superfamily phosphohydrolase